MEKNNGEALELSKEVQRQYEKGLSYKEAFKEIKDKENEVNEN